MRVQPANWRIQNRDWRRSEGSSDKKGIESAEDGMRGRVPWSRSVCYSDYGHSAEELEAIVTWYERSRRSASRLDEGHTGA